jgi:cysteine synthase
MTIPIIREHDGILVVRDDLFLGGTKARFIPALFDGADEVVYASPCQGGAQTALAQVAANLGKRATIFVAKRSQPHPRSLMAKRLGAMVMQVEPGYLNVVQARAASLQPLLQRRKWSRMRYGVPLAQASWRAA